MIVRGKFRLGREIIGRIYQDDVAGNIFWTDERMKQCWNKSNSLEVGMRSINGL